MSKPVEAWILVGPRASGKTTLGRLLAEHWHLPFNDLDTWVTAASGQSPDDWILSGEIPRFRDWEAQCLRRWLKKPRGILATGGGTPTHSESMELLKQFSPVIWLTANPEIRLERLSRDPRAPLTLESTAEEIARLDQERAAIYEWVSDDCVPCNESLEASLEIFAALRARLFSIKR